jgi:hypothetical protein
LTEKSSGLYDAIGILVPKTRYFTIDDADCHFGNLLVTRDRQGDPPTDCPSCSVNNTAALPKTRVGGVLGRVCLSAAVGGGVFR